MPQVIPAIITLVTGIGTAVTLGALTGGAALAAGAAVIAGSAYAATRLLTPDISMPMSDTSTTRQSTVRGTTEAQKVIYGQALVSGPITYVAVAGTDNNDLYHQIALAGHECEAITDIYFDNEVIAASAINSGNAAGGNVTTGTFGPKSGTTICKINKHLGTATQAADADLLAAFTNYTSAHQGKGIAHLVTKWTLTDESQEVWDKNKPTDVKALVKGKNDIYDPRLDTSAGANPSSSSYQAWSENPALCVANYLTDTTFGLGVSASKIDWAAVVTAADACDATVSIPGSTTEKRFTANGVLFATDSHRANIDKLLSAMNGDLIYTSGKYVINAGVYVAPTESLDEDDLAGAIVVKTSVERSARFNKVTGTYISPAENHKTIEFPAVQLTAALGRDNNETLTKNINLPFTNTSTAAQRIAHKMVQMSDQQTVLVFPANLTGLRVAVGDRVNVTVAELNYSNKVFRCVGWTFSEADETAVNLTLVEDDSGSYADPTVSEYSTVSASGVLTPGFPGVPDPQNLTATAGLKNIELNWTNPTQTSQFTEIAVYASPNSSWASKVEIGRVRGTQFIHDASTAADAIAPNDTRYYWIRALAYGAGSGAGVESDRNPDNDTSNVSATCGRVNWSDVSGTTGAPADNATVGATFGTDARDESGNTIPFNSVDNAVVKQEVLLIETEAGDVLELETGSDFEIQNAGDVAIFASANDATLQANIDSVSNSVSSLQSTVVDLTSGVSDVYVSASAPVAGAGGVPDPIPTFSRWYDSDDSNHPYYWTGSAWVSLEDSRIASNASSITNLTSNLNTTNTNVTTAQTTADSKIATFVQDDPPTATATGDLWIDSNDNNKLYRWSGSAWDAVRDGGIAVNADAIDVLDTTVTNLDGTVSALSASNTSLVSTLADVTKIQGETGAALTAENGDELELETLTTATSALAAADETLQTRVTQTEADITAQATATTTLTTTVEGQTASITTLTESVNGQSARHAVLLNTDGQVVGTVQNSGAAGQSSFDIFHDKFKIATPSGTAVQPLAFDSSTSKLTLQDIELSGDLIVGGTIQASKLKLDGNYFANVNGTLRLVANPNVVTIADSATGTGTASATVNRVSGGTTTVALDLSITGNATSNPGTVNATLTLQRDGSTIYTTTEAVTITEISGEGMQSTQYLATLFFGHEFTDTDTGTGSTAYTLTCSATQFSESFQLAVTTST